MCSCRSGSDYRINIGMLITGQQRIPTSTIVESDSRRQVNGCCTPERRLKRKRLVCHHSSWGIITTSAVSMWRICFFCVAGR